MRKCIRMISFLALASLVWEGTHAFRALGNAIRAIEMNPKSFIARYALSWAVVFFLFFPPGVVCFISAKFDVDLPGWAWLGVIIYSGVAWSVMIYSEVMLMAGFYAWQLKWTKENRARRDAGQPEVHISEVSRPSFTDETLDLLHLQATS
jgi:hypothetical protein